MKSIEEIEREYSGIRDFFKNAKEKSPKFSSLNVKDRATLHNYIASLCELELTLWSLTEKPQKDSIASLRADIAKYCLCS